MSKAIKYFIYPNFLYSSTLQILLYLFFTLNTKAENSKFKIRTIVIDAGHGGIDGGAQGKFSKEKDIALRVSLELGLLINSNIPEVKIIYTRTKDKFVPLFKRSLIAREYADIFISIHCNACTDKTAYGVESYIMSIEQLTNTSEAAKRENAVIKLENRFKENYKDFDARASDAHIIFALQNNANHTNSLRIAQKFQKEIQKHGLRNRGVYQDRFALFYRTLVPSILIEIGFITNEKDEKYMNSPEGRATIVKSIFNTIKDYKEEMEKSI